MQLNLGTDKRRDDLNERIESEVRTSYGKLFHKDTEEGTKDEK